MNPLTHRQRRTASEESPWNDQLATTWGLNQLYIAKSKSRHSTVYSFVSGDIALKR